jgi:hypothetical protein
VRDGTPGTGLLLAVAVDVTFAGEGEALAGVGAELGTPGLVDACAGATVAS